MRISDWSSDVCSSDLQVAEVTGRTRRLIVGRDGRQQLQSRSPRANVAETQAFMDGSKKVLVFSDAGGTGRSCHADLEAKNQARSVHFLLAPRSEERRVGQRCVSTCRSRW